MLPKKPLLHSEHDADASAYAYVFEVQVVHTCSVPAMAFACLFTDFPKSQAVQKEELVEPDKAVDLPAGHCVQALVDELEYEP